MFSVFRGTKYDDIGPNHTKENKNNNKNNNKTTKRQKPAHIVFDFYGPDKELFKSRISTDQTVQKYWGLGIFHTSSHTHGVWKIAKNQSHLVKFGCGNPGILVTFLTGQENHPTFNTFRQFWPWWGVAVVEKIVKPHFGIGQGNVWWVWWGYGHYWPRN